jgi:hypothetical protein
MVNASEQTPLPDITLRTAFTEGMDDLLIDEIADLEGVSRVEWENSIDATAINSMLFLNRRQRSGIASKTVKVSSGKYADNNFKYNRLDDILYSQITREGGWTIEGDLEKVMKDGPKMGENLGKFIYFMDAWEDAEKDQRHKNYNPLLQLKGEEDYHARCKEILTMFLGEAALAFEALPIVENTHILRNILYAGVWSKFTEKKKK